MSRGLSLSAFAAIASTLLTVLGAPTADAAPGPAWSVNLIAKPTAFTRSGEGLPSEEREEYFVIATNVGGAPSSGTFTLSDSLPTNVETNPGLPPSGTNRIAAGGSAALNCAVAGQTVTCEGSESLMVGESVQMSLPVVVSASAGMEVTNSVEITGGGAAGRQATITTPVGPAQLAFGLSDGSRGLKNGYFEAGDNSPGLAGSHPYQTSFTLNFNTTILSNGNLYGVEEPKSVGVTLPRGLYANPTATSERCTEAQLESDLNFSTETGIIEGGCPRRTQVGVAVVVIRQASGSTLVPLVKPVFNMVPPPGSAAELGFDAEAAVYVHVLGHVLSGGEYEVAAKVPDTPAKLQVASTSIFLWGSPTDPAHDAMRGLSGESGGESGTEGCIGRTEAENQCPTDRLSKAFLTLPSDCPQAPLTVSAEVSSWQHPLVILQRRIDASDVSGKSIASRDCSALRFSPSISSRVSNSRADSPTGLAVDLHQPQDQEFADRSTANLRDATVALPVGVSVNPSSANGLGACSEAQIGFEPASDGRLRFSESAQSCPNSSKIGIVNVSTPLLEHDLQGAVYVAKPYANPFNSLFAIYLAVEDEETGILSKLAGEVIPDPRTGQLTATFTENPELPLEDIDLDFFAGNTATLKTRLTCGTYTITSSLVPWSAPEGATAHPTGSFATTAPASGAGPLPDCRSGSPLCAEPPGGHRHPQGWHLQSVRPQAQPS